MVTIQDIVEIVNPSNSKNLQYGLKTADEIKEALENADFVEKSKILLYCLDNIDFSRDKNPEIKLLLRDYASILLLIKGLYKGTEQQEIELFNTAILEYGN